MRTLRIWALRRMRGFLFTIGVAPFLLASAPYGGEATCLPCHASVATAPHADAFKLLSPEERTVACLPCHVTGYDAIGGWLDMTATPHLAGVTCEACHGPGGAHVASPRSHPLPLPTVATCRRCHTNEQDSAFDFDTMKKKVHPVTKEKAP